MCCNHVGQAIPSGRGNLNSPEAPMDRPAKEVEPMTTLSGGRKSPTNCGNSKPKKLEGEYH